LEFYQDVFERVLQAGDVQLMVIGYGFGDEHINLLIADAVKNAGLKVFVWDARSDIVNWLKKDARYGGDVLAGLISTESRQMIEVFPSNQSETETYRTIVSGFFQ